MNPRTVIAAFCVLVIATYALMIDLKGISTDEGIRLAIINGGAAFGPSTSSHDASWSEVLKTSSPYAYQPLYFLIQNSLMRMAQTSNALFFRGVNIFALWICLLGLLALSRSWRLLPRLFMIGVFSFNAYLFMHVLQIREYIVGVAFYIWSTWLVLHLDTRALRRPWADALWFAAYGVFLTLGFFLQSWVVFPAIGQLLFLVARRKGDRGRFFAHLGLSYLIVLLATLPYLQTHQQKVNVGRWGKVTTTIWPQLSNGFHLVLTGHPDGLSRLTEFLFWFWLVLIAGALVLGWSGKFRPIAEASRLELKRHGTLMLLCIGASVAFQIGYCLQVEDLSLWPRYFVIHYFFLMWLIALAFNYFTVISSQIDAPAWTRRTLKTLVGTAFTVMLVSGIFQTRSYYHDPFADTGLSRAYSWKSMCMEVTRALCPGDVVVMNDMTIRSTLTFSWPFACRVLLLPELETCDLRSADRLVYLESYYVLSQRSQLAARMAARGYPHLKEVRLHTADGSDLLSEWQLLVFER